jgi:hypothetical protein
MRGHWSGSNQILSRFWRLEIGLTVTCDNRFDSAGEVIKCEEPIEQTVTTLFRRLAHR